MNKENERDFWFNLTRIKNGWLMKYQCFMSDGSPTRSREGYFGSLTEAVIAMKCHIENLGVEKEFFEKVARVESTGFKVKGGYSAVR